MGDGGVYDWFRVQGLGFTSMTLTDAKPYLSGGLPFSIRKALKPVGTMGRKPRICGDHAGIMGLHATAPTWQSWGS